MNEPTGEIKKGFWEKKIPRRIFTNRALIVGGAAVGAAVGVTGALVGAVMSLTRLQENTTPAGIDLNKKGEQELLVHDGILAKFAEIPSEERVALVAEIQKKESENIAAESVQTFRLDVEGKRGHELLDFVMFTKPNSDELRMYLSEQGQIIPMTWKVSDAARGFVTINWGLSADDEPPSSNPHDPLLGDTTTIFSYQVGLQKTKSQLLSSVHFYPPADVHDRIIGQGWQHKSWTVLEARDFPQGVQELWMKHGEKNQPPFYPPGTQPNRPG
jgi:hypothetical protein